MGVFAMGKEKREIVKKGEPFDISKGRGSVFDLLRRDMDTVFDDFFRRDFFAPFPWAERLPRVRQPALDLVDKGDRIVATVELPGLKKEDIKLDVSEDHLEVSAEKKADIEEKRKSYYRRERSYAGFYRSIPLPSEINPDKVKARYENGVLEIELPKIKTSKPSKEVKVD